TAEQLLAELNKFVPEKTQRQAKWPKCPRSLSSYLRRLAPPLRGLGWEVSVAKEGNHKMWALKLPQPQSARTQSTENGEELPKTEVRPTAREAVEELKGRIKARRKKSPN